MQQWARSWRRLSGRRSSRCGRRLLMRRAEPAAASPRSCGRWCTSRPAASAAPAQTEQTAIADNRNVLATPAVRKYARERNAASQFHGTGKNGRITREDVDAYLAGGGAGTCSIMELLRQRRTAIYAESLRDNAIEERVPLKGIRKVIANAMVKSVYTAPHVTVMDEVDVTKLVELPYEAKPIAEKKGIKLTYLPFIVKALVAAVKQFPVINARSMTRRTRLYTSRYYNIGIATDTDKD